ncbi:MAG: T9SS type A sorting domain-containing protein, partial [Saprospiraceae bacterium]|nr:T9SS type A sorting domain-containing protein [Saprospiraceae bacterium]
IQNSFGCATAQTDTITVNPLTSITWTNPLAGDYCVYETPFVITANPTSTPPSTTGVLAMTQVSSGGTTTNTITNPYNFDPALILGLDSVANTVQLIYTFTDTNGCVNTSSQSTTIYPQPEASITQLASTYCAGNAPIGLFPTPTGGVLSSSVGNGNLNIGAQNYHPLAITGGQDTIRYIYQDFTTGCYDTVTQVTEVASAGITLGWVNGTGLPNDVCYEDTVIVVEVDLQGQTNFGTPPYFTTSGSTDPYAGIVFQDATTVHFNPSQVNPGQGVITYTYTSSGAGACATSLQDVMTINPLPDLRLTFGIGLGVAGFDSTCQNYPPLPVLVRDLNVNTNPLPSSPNTVVTGPGIIPNYQFHPDTASIGWNFIELAHEDANGCRDTIIDSIKVLQNIAPLINGLDSVYCETSGAVNVIGVPTGGTWNTLPPFFFTPSGGAVPTFDPQQAPVGIHTVSYTITQSNGCQNTTNEQVEVQASPVVQIVSPSLGQVFCDNDATMVMEATANGVPTSGIFYETSAGGTPQSFVINDTIFDPAAATGTRFLNFAFSDPVSGCTDTVSSTVNVINSPTALFTGLNSTYCIDGTVETINFASFGYTSLSSVNYSMNSNAIVPLGAGSNYNALFYTDSVGIGTDTLTLTISANGCTDSYSQEVMVEGLPQGVFISGLLPVYCENTNDQLPDIKGSPINGTSQGFTIRDTLTNQIVYQTSNNTIVPNPMDYGMGSYEIIYTYTNLTSCSNRDTGYFDVHPKPRAVYQQDSFCLGDSIRVLDFSFMDTTLNNLDTIVNWYWTYNGLFTGTTTVPMIPATYLYNEPVGFGQIDLVVETQAGCMDTLRSVGPNADGFQGDTVKIFSVPKTQFSVTNGCEGQDVIFTGLNAGLTPQVGGVTLDSITTVIWDFGNGDSLVLNPQTNINTGQASYTFNDPGIYNTVLRITNQGLCVNEQSARLVISPKVNPYPLPYFADFQSGPQDWFQEIDTNYNYNFGNRDTLWEWGIMQGNVINTDTEQDFVWGTSLNSEYAGNVATWVYGPCFDFRESVRPMVKMNIFSDMQTFDGATFEYLDTTVMPYVWRTLGKKDQGQLWYNSDQAFGLQNIKDLSLGEINALNAWNGTYSTWRSARFRLDQFKGFDNVRFRVSFGSLNTGGLGTGDGFAFDDVWVGERTRNVIIEHFANINYPSMESINNDLYAYIFNEYNGNDVLLAQYHIDEGGSDEVYQFNTEDAGARTLYYGANVAQAIVDGNSYLGPTSTISQRRLDLDMLQDPKFRIEKDSIQISYSSNGLSKTIRVTGQLEALRNMPQDEYIIRVALLQDDVSTFLVQDMQSVFRKYLPDHPGLRYLQNWTSGDIATFDESWTSTQLQNLDSASLHVLVFIQNETTKEIYQANTSRNLNYTAPYDPISGIEEQVEINQEIFEMNLYPNPAQNYFNVSFEQPLQDDYQWRLMDMLGRTLHGGTTMEGDMNFTVNTNQIPSGAYVFVMQNEDGTVFAQRQVIIRD